MFADFKGWLRAPFIHLLMTFTRITNLLGSVQWCKIRTMLPEGGGRTWLPRARNHWQVLLSLSWRGHGAIRGGRLGFLWKEITCHVTTSSGPSGTGRPRKVFPLGAPGSYWGHRGAAAPLPAWLKRAGRIMDCHLSEVSGKYLGNEQVQWVLVRVWTWKFSNVEITISFPRINFFSQCLPI